ncbi:MAG: malto-oligosyltrehalose trehalohydrolase [Gammaproteobacteria bacterium]
MTGQNQCRHHDMPFGSRILENGDVRFQLWAPAADTVDLCLEPGDRQVLLPMTATGDGWFILDSDQASTGSFYSFRINQDIQVPDPASRFQPKDVHGPSEIIDPRSWRWRDDHWRGRPWEEAVVYELHVGSFTTEGTFDAVQEKLDYLIELGITAIELMPVADFPGKRNWGYDGVYLFAPDSQYGTPNDLKALIDAAHGRGLMVLLDVVYNHFGPEGNYLHAFAPQFFTERHHTPWGAAINFDGEHSHWVRQFFIHNTLYWLEEYHFDGLRLDAVHAIIDDSQPDILTELADAVHRQFHGDRHIHLILENDHNAAHYLQRDEAKRPKWYDAQWNDDIHHALHVILTGETNGYYKDYSNNPCGHLKRCLCEGFAYQGEPSPYREQQPRGEPSGHLPATAFVSFLQNHDQIGNRAFGERINILVENGKWGDSQLRAALSLLLLSPSPPLLFMGQEWGCRQPFYFFCDFGEDLAQKVVEGRRGEFARFPEFSDPHARERIPDPTTEKTFCDTVLDWQSINLPAHKSWLDLHRELLTIRRNEIVPRLRAIDSKHNTCTSLNEHALTACWMLNDGSQLFLLANLGSNIITGINPPHSRVLHTTHHDAFEVPYTDEIPPWSVTWYLEHPAASD